jgi:hypothetical protein
MIDDRTVAHVARLGRLELSPEELDRFRTQVREILADTPARPGWTGLSRRATVVDLLRQVATLYFL